MNLKLSENDKSLNNSIEDSLYKEDASGVYNPESDYLTYKTEILSETLPKLCFHEKSHKKKVLEKLNIILIMLLSIAFVIALILFLAVYFRGSTPRIDSYSKKILGKWLGENDIVYTFTSNGRVILDTPSQSKKDITIKTLGNYTINENNVLEIETKEDHYSYHMSFQDKNMTWTHDYNGIPEVIHLKPINRGN